MESEARRSYSWGDMLCGVISESKRVVAAHSRHFLALSILFLLPLSSLIVAAPSLLSLSSSHRNRPIPPSRSLLRLSNAVSLFSAAAARIIFYFAAVLVLYLGAAASVSSSVHRGFFDRPVRIVSVLRSLLLPFLRLLSTLFSAFLVLAAISTLFASLTVAALKSLSFFHLPLLYSTPIYVAFSVIGLVAFAQLLIDWSLAVPIAVCEPIWGFSPLLRSAKLIAGMRWASAVLFAFFAASIGIILWGFSLDGVGINSRDIVPLVFKTVFGSAVIAVLLLYCIVINTVLYMYCKALHGELAEEIAEEFAWQYVSLPFDEHKVPRVVSVVRRH